MECTRPFDNEDISATMMRRARCLHVTKYSMDTASNIKMLAREMPPEGRTVERENLLQLWIWIHRIEVLVFGGNAEDIMDEGSAFWASKGLDSVGVWNLLHMGRESDQIGREDVHFSDSLACKTYDSTFRR